MRIMSENYNSFLAKSRITINIGRIGRIERKREIVICKYKMLIKIAKLQNLIGRKKVY